MNKLLVICGATATGKTSLAFNLAKKYPLELVSADSRQVYKQMDIGTGKDLPKKSKLNTQKSKLGSYYQINEIKLWGYDLVDPKREFSVADYLQIVCPIIKNIQKQGKLPVVVGGTGLYIKAVIDGIETVDIPKNDKVRQKLKDKRQDDLLAILKKLNPKKAESFNKSDIKNPRRLVRAIEIEIYKKENPITTNTDQSIKRCIDDKWDMLMIGLRAPRSVLKERIKKRVEERIAQGIEEEIRKLLKNKVGWDYQSMNTIGYKQWKIYFQGRSTKKQIITSWITDEVNYAKRQLTWFKKDKRIVWFDVSQKDWRDSVENLINKWYG